MSRKKKNNRSRNSDENKPTRPIREYELQHREQALLDLLQTYPNQILKGLARQPEAEWTFGRLFLVGVISYSQYEAAKYLAKITRDYETQLRRYGNLRASSFTKTDGMVLEDLSLSAQKRFERTKKRYDEVYSLLDQCGNVVSSSIITTLRTDEKTDLNAIRRGLEVLATGLFSTRGQRR